ncbi:MAG: CPBP family intramembrane glutamic endopeptidase [Thermoplasmatota archaeon]
MCLVSQVPDATAFEYYAGSWILAFLVAGAIYVLGSSRGRAWRGVGGGLMSVPAWRLLVVTAPDMVRTFCAQGNLNLVIPPGQTVPAETFHALSSQVISEILPQLGYVCVGAFAWLEGVRPGWWRRPRVEAMAHDLAPLVPMGKGEARSLRNGFLLFPLLAVANLVLLWATDNPSIHTGNDSAVFSQVTLYHVVLLSLAAGFAEEIVFRGVMQQSLKRGMAFLWNRVRPPRAASAPGRGHRALRGVWLSAAILLQAIPFAYAHAGYANLQHLLFAFLFAVVAGVVVETFGMWTAIVLHTLVDAYAFLLSPATLPASFVAVGAGLALVIFLVSSVTLLNWIGRRARPS